jgi:hypothetical protein
MDRQLMSVQMFTLCVLRGFTTKSLPREFSAVLRPNSFGQKLLYRLILMGESVLEVDVEADLVAAVVAVTVTLVGICFSCFAIPTWL